MRVKIMENFSCDNSFEIYVTGFSRNARNCRIRIRSRIVLTYLRITHSSPMYQSFTRTVAHYRFNLKIIMNILSVKKVWFFKPCICMAYSLGERGGARLVIALNWL